MSEEDIAELGDESYVTPFFRLSEHVLIIAGRDINTRFDERTEVL